MAGIAIRRLMRGEDGGIRVALIDLNTLQEVTDPTDYTVLEPDNGKIEDIPYAQQPKSAQTVAEPGEVPVEATTIKEAQEYASGGKLDSGDAATGMRGMERDATNNFGYMSKPKGLGLASMLPGPAGMVGKAVNAGINANNMTASEKARGYLGLSPSSTFGKVKGVLSDNQGVVSKSANIGGYDYGISFGGISKDGKHTTLTPDEARTRSLTMDAPVKEGEVSERGQGYRAPSATGNVAPSSKAVGTLGANSVTQTGTKQGLAGRLGGIEASNPGTVGLAATPESMSAMKDMSAPIGIDAENEADMSGRMSQAWAGKLGDVAAKSVKTGAVTTGSVKNTNLAGTPSAPTAGDALRNSFTANPEANAPAAAGQAMSPAAFSGAGAGRQYSVAEKSAMAKTLAGELNGKTLRGIVAGDPAALAEAAAALGTMDNRVNSVKNIDKPDPVASTLVGSQYNANMTKALKNGTVPASVTARNYKTFGAPLDTLVDNYVAGKIDSPAPNATHYVNKDVAAPAWGDKVNDKYGPHTFGTPDKSFAASAKGYGSSYGFIGARQVTDKLGNITTPTEAYSGAPEATANPGPLGLGTATGVNSGFSPNLGGLMGNLAAKNTPESRMGISGSGFSPSSPGGMTGFGRTASLGGSTGTSNLSGAARGGLSSVGGGTGSRSTGPSKGTGSVADGSKGNESYGGGASKGTGGLGGNPGAGAYGGGSTKSSGTGGFADGKKGSESYGGGSTTSSSKSSSSSSSSKGSASSSSGGPRGGASTGRGMGGFN